MGHIVPTPAGGYRANWRDAAGRQRAKTFATKREAKAYLAEVESAVSRGLYVDPHAGRLRFGAYAARWLNARNDEITTAARDASIMRNHVVARWCGVPKGGLHHLTW
jgi:Arm DNA-binding domain